MTNTEAASARHKKTNIPSADKSIKIIKSFLRRLAIYLVSLSIVIGTVIMAVFTVVNYLTAPVDANDISDTKVEIPQGSTVTRIADILYDNNLIKNKGLFKIFIDFSGKGRKLQAGRYKLSKSMTMEQIMNSLLTGGTRIPNIKVTIQEGLTVKQIADKLVNTYNLPFTEQEFLEAARVENFTEYDFLQAIPEKRRNGPAPLEGYLFPETYIVPEDSSPKLIIKLMLNQFEKIVFKEEYIQKAEELNLTTDEVVTLASIIQKEAKVKEEFNKVSAVFHNRLKKGMKLESCATVQYVLVDNDKENKLILTEEEMETDSLYNTYKYPGLPEGPISAPGEWSIIAALSPYKPYMDQQKPYLYFVLMDPDTGQHKFNYSYAQHVKDTNEFEKLWK